MFAARAKKQLGPGWPLCASVSPFQNGPSTFAIGQERHRNLWASLMSIPGNWYEHEPAILTQPLQHPSRARGQTSMSHASLHFGPPGLKAGTE